MRREGRKEPTQKESYRSSHKRCPIKELFLEILQCSQEKHLCRSLFSIKIQAWRSATFLKKTPAQGFSCECCEIFKNTYLEEHLRRPASEFYRIPDFKSLPRFSLDNYLPNKKSWYHYFRIILMSAYFYQCCRGSRSEVFWQ